MSDTKQIKVIILHNKVQITNTGLHVIFHYKLKGNDGIFTKLEYALDRKDTEKIERLKEFLLMKVNSFIFKDMKIQHYKNDIYVITAGKWKLTVNINEAKREEIKRFLKFGVTRWRVNRRITVS